MSTNAVRTDDASSDTKGTRVDMKLEVVVIPVSDVDRAKEFYGRLGWRLHAEFVGGDALRRAEAAHAEHERRTGLRDANWPDRYAAFMVAEQAGELLPS